MNSVKGWDWDHALQTTHGRWTEVAEELFPFVNLLAKGKLKTVYDLGCGVGRHTVFLAQQGFDVTASDVSLSAVRKTREWLANEKTNANVVELDMLTWPFDHGTFDAIIAYNVVYHAMRNEVERVLEQAFRVLTLNGVMLVTFKSSLDSDYGEGNRLDRATYAPVAGVEKGIPHYYVDEEEIRRLLQNFELIKLIHKQELPVLEGEGRKRAHWVAWVKKTF